MAEALPFQERGGMNPLVSGLFKAVGNPQPVSTNDTVKKGTLMAFSYAMFLHDPYPLLIVTDVHPGYRLRGVNLHYLTFPYIKNLLRAGGGNPMFSYGTIRGDSYIVNAFRSYKWQGIRQIKVLDVEFLLTVMATVRSFDPSQVAAIRRSVQEQIRQQVNPRPTEPPPQAAATVPARPATVATTPAVPATQATSPATPATPTTESNPIT